VIRNWAAALEFERDSQEQINRIQQQSVGLADTDSRYGEVQKLRGGAGKLPARDDWSNNPGVSPDTLPDPQAMDYRLPEFGDDGYMRTLQSILFAHGASGKGLVLRGWPNLRLAPLWQD
jgi:hypothetical protein